MRFLWLPCSIVLSGIALLSGCGGGSSSAGSGGGGSSNPTEVTVNFGAVLPTAIATQIGSAALTPVTPSSTVSISLPKGTTKFAVAFVCPTTTISSGLAQNQLSTQTVEEATVSDGTFYSFFCAPADSKGTTGSLSFSVDASAIIGATEVSVQAENAQHFAQGPFGLVTSNATLAAPVGTDRVDVLAWNLSPNVSNQYVLTTNAARSFPSQAVPGDLNGGNTVLLGAEDLVTPQSITYTHAPTQFGAPTALVDYLPTGSTYSLLLAIGATTTYPVLPAGVAQGGGIYEIQAEAFSLSSPFAAVAVLQRSSTAGPVSIDFPTPWFYAGPAAAAFPTMTFDYAGFSGRSGVTQASEMIWLTGQNAQSIYIVRSSAAYQGSSSTLTMPNLSRLSGFLPPPPSGAQATWSAAVLQSDSGSFQLASGVSTQSTVLTDGTFTVP